MFKILINNKYKIFTSMIFGLLGFFINFHTINFPFGEYSATILLGLLFPMMIALSWGWKYGLLSALFGGCQSMWWLWGANNGYAILFVAPPFTLWIIWHGVFAELRRKQKSHKWWLSMYVVEIPFRILSSINLLTLCRWAITFNPPSWNWAAKASNTIPMHFSIFVTIKQATIGFVILLLVDVLLNIKYVRIFFKLKKYTNYKKTGYIISLFLLFGCLFWLLDSLFYSFIFHQESSFTELLAINIPNYNFFIRIGFFFFCLVSGLITSRILRSQKKGEIALNKSEEKFRAISESAIDSIFIKNLKLEYIHVNPAMEKLFGLPASALIGKTDIELFGEVAGRYIIKTDKKIIEGEVLIDEHEKAVKGKLYSFSTIKVPLKNTEGEIIGLCGIARDITESKKKEQEIKHLNSILRGIRDVNKLITREKNIDKLIKKTCERLVEQQSYFGAWIILFDKSGKYITSAETGLDKNYLSLVEMLKKDKKPDGMKKTLKQAGIIIIENPSEDCADCPLSKNYKDNSLMKIRLEHDDNILGLISVATPKNFIISEEEQSMFKEVAGDIAFALHNINLEKEKKETEHLLIKSEKKYRTLFEKSKDAILIIRNGKFVDCNQATINMLRYNNKDEFLNIHPSELSPERQPDGKNSFSKANEMMEIALEKGGHRFEWSHKRSNGEVFPVEVMLTAISNDKNNQILHTVWRDISERKQAEKLLIESETHYRQLFDLLPYGGEILDKEGKIINCSLSTSDMLGYDMDELIGKNITNFVDNDTVKVFQQKFPILLSGKSLRLEVRMKHKTGKLLNVLRAADPILNADGEVESILALNVDISERKKAEEQIKINLKEKEILLKELYHRTKNNMQIISSMLSTQSKRSNNEFIHNSFREIIMKIRAMSLVHQKLYESKNLSQINLKEYIKDLFYLLIRSYSIKSEKISLRLDLKDVFILIDSAMPLGLILNELITNIFKYAFPNDRKGEIFIRLYQEEEGMINIYLEDNGVGVPQNTNLKEMKSMGLKTVFSLAEYQLSGSITYDIDKGVKWHIKFKDDRHEKRI